MLGSIHKHIYTQTVEFNQKVYVHLKQCGKYKIGSVMHESLLEYIRFEMKRREREKNWKYHSSVMKCRSAAIYLSRIDASPEVNGRVVTISPWTLGLILSDGYILEHFHSLVIPSLSNLMVSCVFESVQSRTPCAVSTPFVILTKELNEFF